MTGRELIVYILKNNLEDQEVIKDGKIMGFLTTEEAAVKLNVGPATVETVAGFGVIPSYQVKSGLYFPINVKELYDKR